MRLLVAVVLLLAPGPVFAWDAKGHRIIAAVAERRLRESSPEILKKALDLLGEKSLVDVAMRAEDWATKPGGAHTATWHFVNIPLDTAKYDAARDCPHSNCMVEAVTKLRREFWDLKVDPALRKEALIYLVHLIGDTFQGWHCASGTLSDGSSDENGTRIRLTYKGGHLPGNTSKDPKNDNAHFLWDVALLEFEGRDEAAMVEHLFTDTLGDRKPDDLYTGPAHFLAEYAHDVAQRGPRRDGQDLSEDDMKSNAADMDEQLLVSGLNLARMIQFAYGPPAAAAGQVK